MTDLKLFPWKVDCASERIGIKYTPVQCTDILKKGHPLCILYHEITGCSGLKFKRIYICGICEKVVHCLGLDRIGNTGCSEYGIDPSSLSSRIPLHIGFRDKDINTSNIRTQMWILGNDDSHGCLGEQEKGDNKQ